MYRFNAEDPGQSLYTPTTVGVIWTDIYNTRAAYCTQHREELNQMYTHTFVQGTQAHIMVVWSGTEDYTSAVNTGRHSIGTVTLHAS